MIEMHSGINNVKYSKCLKIVQPVNLYGCTIGTNCFVGPFVEIQSNVVIGNDTKIQSHSFICEFVSIGSGCFVGHGVMFINDTFSQGGPANGDKSLWRSTTIGDKVSIGSNATILPVTICSGAVIGAGAVVVQDVLEPGVYVGNPAHKVKDL